MNVLADWSVQCCKVKGWSLWSNSMSFSALEKMYLINCLSLYICLRHVDGMDFSHFGFSIEAFNAP